MANISSIGGNPIVPAAVQNDTITDAMLKQTGGVLSEVHDIRTGADGTTYASAGEAVRSTESKLGNVVKQYNSIEPYLYKRDTYIANGNVDTTLAGYDTYKIPVKENDLIVIHWTADWWLSMSALYALTVEYEDGTIERTQIDNSRGTWFRFSSSRKEGIARMPENAKYFVITANRSSIGNLTSVTLNTPNMVLNDDSVVRKTQTLTRIDEECADWSTYFFAVGNDMGLLDGGYGAFLMPIHAGDKVVFDSLVLTYYGTFFGFTSGTTVMVTASEFTATEDGILCEFPQLDKTPNATLFAHDAIKIDASNVVNMAAPSFDGLTWVSFGDSITERGSWQPYVIDALGMSHTNCGIGSTAVSGTGSTAFWQATRLDAVKAANPDIVTILGGANDLVVNPVIGTNANLADKDTSTFIGAYSYIINNLLTWKPSLRIFILSTTWAHDDGATYSQTVTYGQFAEACKTVAEYYKLPFVDLYNNSGFNSYTMGSSPNNIYSSDSIHPNDAGGKVIASQVIEKMREVMQIH